MFIQQLFSQSLQLNREYWGKLKDYHIKMGSKMKAKYAPLSSIWPQCHICFSNTCESIWHRLPIIPQDFSTSLFFQQYLKMLTHLLNYFWKTQLCLPSGFKIQIYKSYRTALPAIKLGRLPKFSKKTSIGKSINIKRGHSKGNNSGHRETLAVPEAPLLNCSMALSKFNPFLTHFAYLSELWYKIGLRIE